MPRDPISCYSVTEISAPARYGARRMTRPTDANSLNRRTALWGAAALALAPFTRAADPLGAVAQDVASLGAPDSALEAKIAALAAEAGLPKVGFAAVDIAKGRTAFVRGGELFPMSGLNGLPVAIAFLKLVQDGAARLDARIHLKAADIVPGRSPIGDRLRKRPTMFTSRQLIEHVLLNNDTTATDALVKLAGGTAGIAAVLKRFDIQGLRIDRSERELARDTGNLNDKAALDRYLADPRDTVSPRAMATLLVKLQSGHLLQPRFVLLVTELMRRTKLGDDRLKGGFVPGWSFAHRASSPRSIEGATLGFHDAGLANGKGGTKIALAIMIERATLSPAELAQFHRATARAVLQDWGQSS